MQYHSPMNCRHLGLSWVFCGHIILPHWTRAGHLLLQEVISSCIWDRAVIRLCLTELHFSRNLGDWYISSTMKIKVLIFHYYPFVVSDSCHGNGSHSQWRKGFLRIPVPGVRRWLWEHAYVKNISHNSSQTVDTDHPIISVTKDLRDVKKMTTAMCLVASDSLRLHGLGSAKLFCPWDSLGKNTGVGSHFFLQITVIKMPNFS